MLVQIAKTQNPPLSSLHAHPRSSSAVITINTHSKRARGPRSSTSCQQHSELDTQASHLSNPSPRPLPPARRGQAWHPTLLHHHYLLRRWQYHFAHRPFHGTTTATISDWSHRGVRLVQWGVRRRANGRASELMSQFAPCRGHRCLAGRCSSPQSGGSCDGDDAGVELASAGC